MHCLIMYTYIAKLFTKARNDLHKSDISDYFWQREGIYEKGYAEDFRYN